MIDSKYDVLPFLPETKLREHSPGITLLNPLSRRGHGPGLIVLVSETGVKDASSLRIESGVPSPLMKWGEEGYSVVEITEATLTASPQAAIQTARTILEESDATQPKNAVGLIGKLVSDLCL
jgi:carboxymethylenebutenolidase